MGERSVGAAAPTGLVAWCRRAIAGVEGGNATAQQAGRRRKSGRGRGFVRRGEKEATTPVTSVTEVLHQARTKSYINKNFTTSTLGARCAAERERGGGMKEGGGISAVSPVGRSGWIRNFLPFKYEDEVIWFIWGAGTDGANTATSRHLRLPSLPWFLHGKPACCTCH